VGVFVCVALIENFAFRIEYWPFRSFRSTLTLGCRSHHVAIRQELLSDRFCDISRGRTKVARDRCLFETYHRQETVTVEQLASKWGSTDVALSSQQSQILVLEDSPSNSWIPRHRARCIVCEPHAFTSPPVKFRRSPYARLLLRTCSGEPRHEGWLCQLHDFEISPSS
jgi:hypothetical protein